MEEEEAREILPRIRTAAINLKRSLFDKEIVGIYNEWQKGHLNWKIAEEN